MQTGVDVTSPTSRIARAVERVNEIKQARAIIRKLLKDANADRISDEALIRDMRRALALLEDLEHSAKYAVVKAARRAVKAWDNER